MVQSVGHRSRVRERYNKADIRDFADYEILEMLLFYSIPRADTKQIAKQLLKRYGSLAGVFGADPADVIRIEGVGEATVYLFKLLSDAFSRLFIPVNENAKFNILNNWQAVINYCRLTMGVKKSKEYFRVLYMNSKNHLIDDQVDEGTVDKVLVYPREIARKVIEIGASAIILVHNHPSGDPKPSHEDIVMTRSIAEAIKSLGATVHDHIIICDFEHFSFRSNKLI